MGKRVFCVCVCVYVCADKRAGKGRMEERKTLAGRNDAPVFYIEARHAQVRDSHTVYIALCGLCVCAYLALWHGTHR